MKNYIRLLKCKHYLKNLLVLFSIVFSSNLFQMNILIDAMVGFLIFSLASSVVYIFNDIRDVERDRLHPIKSMRPLASGSISIKKAYFIEIVLVIFIILLNIVFKANVKSFLIVTIYLIINFAYSLGLKDYVLIDIIILALGFVLRLLYGGIITDIGVSNWMFLTVVSAAFYLSLGKRLKELIKYGDAIRKSLSGYTVTFLKESMHISMSLTIVFYALSCSDKTTTVAQHGVNLLWTVPIVLIICLRYNLILEKNEIDGDPVEVVLKDKALLSLIGFYACIILLLLYVF